MDDSGFFSVQVISKALEVWGLELISYTRYSRDGSVRVDQFDLKNPRNLFFLLQIFIYLGNTKKIDLLQNK